MSIAPIVTHIIAFLVGVAGGWLAYGRWGAEVTKVESEVKNIKP